jgi:predicted NACHT family NTPase
MNSSLKRDFVFFNYFQGFQAEIAREAQQGISQYKCTKHDLSLLTEEFHAAKIIRYKIC